MDCRGTSLRDRATNDLFVGLIPSERQPFGTILTDEVHSFKHQVGTILNLT